MDTTFAIAGFAPFGAEIGDMHHLESPAIVKITCIQEEILRRYPETNDCFIAEIFRRFVKVDLAAAKRNMDKSFAFVLETENHAQDFNTVLEELRSSAKHRHLDLTDFQLLKLS